MSCVDSGGRNKAFLTFSVSLISFFLLFFPSFVRKLIVIGAMGD